MNTEVNEIKTQDTEKSSRAKAQADACLTIINNTTTLLETIVAQGQAFSTLGFPDDHMVFHMLNDASALVFDVGHAMARAVAILSMKHGSTAHVDPSKVS